MNLRPILQKLYPTGSSQGQCGDFCHLLADFGQIGDSYSQKKQYVRLNGIIVPNIENIGRGFRVGDVVVTSEGTFLGFGNGHVAFVADMDDTYLYLAESNFNKDGRVHYGRSMPKNSSKIFGIIREPFKFDLGQCVINYDVFFNNQLVPVSFLTQIQEDVLKWTNNKLKLVFFPLDTHFQNWWYETQLDPFAGQQVSYIAKAYFDNVVFPLAFTNSNKPADVVALVIRPDQFQGQITGGQELAYTTPNKPIQIQISADEHTPSPWYPNMTLLYHALIHELAHGLHFINGMDDTTHLTDNRDRSLEKVFYDLEFNRIKSNL